MAYEGCYDVWILKAGVYWRITISWVSIDQVFQKLLLFFFSLSCWEIEPFILLVFCRIDSLEKFRERIPFMRSELKDERMCCHGNPFASQKKLHFSKIVFRSILGFLSNPLLHCCIECLMILCHYQFPNFVIKEKLWQKLFLQCRNYFHANSFIGKKWFWEGLMSVLHQMISIFLLLNTSNLFVQKNSERSITMHLDGQKRRWLSVLNWINYFLN